METRKTIVLFIIIAFSMQGCVVADNTADSDSLEPEIVYLDRSEFEKLDEDKEEKQFIEVPTVQFQEGQLKPLPGDDPKDNINQELADLDTEPTPKNTKNNGENNEVVVRPVPIPIPSKRDKSLLTQADRELIASLAKKTVLQTAVIGGANQRSQIKPSSLPENWINAITVYDYMEGALYQVYLTPGRTTDIIFGPGENIISKSAGDSLRWMVGETESGSGESRKSHLMVKPTHPNIDTNLTVTTDQRTYYLELHSTKNKAYMAAVQWNYPGTDFITRYKQTRKKEKQESKKILELTNLDKMNFDYIFKTDGAKDDIEWFPVRAFDNGQKTFIQFPPDMKHKQSPALYVLSNESTRKPQIVNYRTRDGFYVVDRLFQAAVLMEGTKTQRKVTILNQKLHREYRQQDLFARESDR